MFDFETSVTSIELKTRQLADEVARLRRQVSEADDRCHALEEALKDKEILINNLKEENKLVKLGNRLSEKGETAELKLKIKKMIRDIDKRLEKLQQTE